MIFWLFYLLSLIIFLYLISTYFRKYNFSFIFFSFIFLITPTQIELGSTDYGPAVFSFMFDLILEQKFSTRTLRPLALTMSTGLIFFWVYKSIKKRFS